ncbi:cupin domain-containing protein [Paraburkholderia sacchari]|uniref:cupin domain-containing protein n=1 Tax=Paraburkholderia sacchari TaxID=159450 RepID=UPI001BCE130B|nr:cupin domain-containing protein [Paraburkholderia sacchari]
MTTAHAIRQRFIPFSSLRYCTDAFIDYRIPGCAPKYNYALVGPGVSQNPNQPVSLREPHGFQVGGVAMPPGVTNPPHMHFTCEVFICTRGQWELHWGFNPEKLTAQLGPGDICSVPTWIYRGFRNMGKDDGFMFTALGGNDTGGILWGPSTLEAAAREGVYLTEKYEIIDESRGQAFPDGVRPLQPMTPDEIKTLRHWSAEDMQQRIVRFADLVWSRQALLDSALDGCGASLAPVIGLGMTQDRDHQAPVPNAHGFSLEWLKIPAGGCISTHRIREKQVLIVRSGQIDLSVESTDGLVTQTLRGEQDAWDSFSIPGDCWRTLRNTGCGDALAVVITEGDHRKSIEWHDDVIEAAAGHDRALDASGFVAPKRFIDRSQR